MKVLQILKSRIGNVSKAGLLGVGVTAGLVGLNLYNYATEGPAAQEQKIRSLSQIIASGDSVPAEYSGINISRGQNEFATAEEVSARQGRMFDGGEGAVAALSGISVRGTSLGQGEGGLGMGENAATAVAGPRAAAGVHAPDGSAIAAAASEKAKGTQINKLGAEKAGGLQRASMARASGANFSTGGPGFGAPATPARSAARSEAASRIGASSISGAMPEGSTLVASNGSFRGAASSSFVPAGRNSRVGQGLNSKEGRDLRSIALQSGKVAANRHRSDNEAAQVFMGGERLSGGIQTTDGSVTTGGTASTEDFEGALQAKQANLDAGIEEIDTTEQERAAKRSQLGRKLVALLFATIGAMIAISTLRGKGLWGTIAAAAVTAAMVLSLGLFLADCGKYISKYKSDAASVVFTVCGVLFLAAVGIAWVKSVSSWIAKIVGKVGKGLGLGEGFASGTGVSAALGSVEGAVKDVSNATSEDGSGLKNG